MTHENWMSRLIESDRLMLAEAHAAEEDREEAREADAGFDGGEFSGPAHHEALMREFAEIAAKYGRDEDHLMTLLMEENCVQADEEFGAMIVIHGAQP